MADGIVISDTVTEQLRRDHAALASLVQQLLRRGVAPAPTGTPSNYLAKVTGSHLTARSGTTPGEGTITIVGAGATEIDRDVWTDQPALNISLLPILTDTYGKAFRDAWGVWWFLPDRNWLTGKTDASIAKAASGTVSIYTGTTDTTINVTAVNRFADIDSGKWTAVETDGVQILLAAKEC